MMGGMDPNILNSFMGGGGQAPGAPK